MTTMYEPTADRDTNAALLTALQNHCTCGYNPAGARITACPGHMALVNGDAWITRLLFERHEAARLMAEEFRGESSAQPVQDWPVSDLVWESYGAGFAFLRRAA